MDLYLDIKYLNLISNSLQQFKRKTDKLWNCRCSICGDSQVKKTKARGYFFVKGQSLRYMCHNCGASMSFNSFLKNHNGQLYAEYCLERYKKPANKNDVDPDPPPVPYFAPKRLIDQLMDRLDTLPEDNIAVQYANSRGIPKHRFTDLYFVDNVKNLEQLSERYRDKIQSKEPRLVLPFFDWKGQITGLTARALGNESLRYITLKIKEDELLIFGTESVNIYKRVYCCEGPIDSLFIDNCIAVAGTGFTKLDQLHLDKNNLTVIIDNQPRNREVVKLYRQFIDKGYSICIWPDLMDGKDINEYIQNGMSREAVKQTIDTNTYSGLQAMVKFNQWRKV